MIRTMRMHYRFPRLQALAERTGRPITALDLETTGLSTTQSGVVQVGLVTVKPGVPTRGLVGFVNPQMTIPPDASAVHGITDDQIAGASPFSEWGSVLAKIVLHTVTGFNLAIYDVPVIHAQCLRYGIDAPKFEHLCDLREVLREHNKQTTKELNGHGGSLAYHAERYGVNQDFRHDAKHDALDDALTVLLIAEAMLDQHGDAVLGIDRPPVAADRGMEHDLSLHY